MASNGEEALDRLLRYLYTGKWRDEVNPGASATAAHTLARNPTKPWLEGVTQLGRRAWNKKKFENEAGVLRTYICNNLDELRTAKEALDVDDGRFDISKVLLDRLDRNDFPSEERFLVLLACSVHCSQPYQAVQMMVPVVHKFCNVSRRLFMFVYVRLTFGGREHAKRMRLQVSAVSDVLVDGTSSSARCWTRWLKRIVSDFYAGKKEGDEFWARLSDVTAHVRGHGWSHEDLIRMAHIKGETDEDLVVILYLVRGLEELRSSSLVKQSKSTVVPKIIKYLEAVETLNSIPASEPDRARALIEEHDFTWDHVPPCFHRNPVVWEALVPKLPVYQLWSRLRVMAIRKVIVSSSSQKKGSGGDSASVSGGNLLVSSIVERLLNPEQLALFGGGEWPVRNRLHPLSAYYALKLHRDPELEWKFRTKSINKSSGMTKTVPKMPALDPKIDAAMVKVLHESFKNLPATNLKWLVVVDRSPLTRSNHVNYLDGLKVNEAIAVLTKSVLSSEPAGNVHLASMTTKGVQRLDGLNRDMTYGQFVEFFSKAERTGRSSIVEILDYAKKSDVAFDVILVMSCDIGFTLTANTGTALTTAFTYEQDVDDYVKVKDKPNFKLIVSGFTSRAIKYVLKKDPRVLYMRGLDHQGPWIMRAFAQNSF